MTTAKNEVFIGLTWKLLFSGGGGGGGWIETFLGGGWANFQLVGEGGGTPPNPF